MILDELKLLIKDLEIILIKDSRFKNDVYFKHNVKTIYLTKNKNEIVDITGLYNLALLNKTKTNNKINNQIYTDILTEINKLKTTPTTTSPSALNFSALENKISNLIELTENLKLQLESISSLI